jgi:hypothetical protein
MHYAMSRKTLSKNHNKNMVYSVKVLPTNGTLSLCCLICNTKSKATKDPTTHFFKQLKRGCKTLKTKINVTIISFSHRVSLLLVTFICGLIHSIKTVVNVKICVV